MNNRLSIALRALAAVGLTVGFYALALAMAGGLLWLPFSSPRFSVRLLIVCAPAAILILSSIIPHPEIFVAPGPELLPAQHPKLFELLQSLARACGQPMPDAVYLSAELNAGVNEHGGVFGFAGRRTLVLGLPLLRVLKVPELRAVLAHEFGHYHGGDTRLGPWLRITHVAIARTIGSLQLARSIISLPFQWYGLGFLRISKAVARRQELAADELAARVAGGDVLIESLYVLDNSEVAFQQYWEREVAPILRSGYLPPLDEGFARFIANSPALSAIRDSIADVKRPAASPHDTHPPLRERVAALQQAPLAAGPSDHRKGVELLGELRELERRMLEKMMPGVAVQDLKSVPWESVCQQVYVPAWNEVTRIHASTLREVTVGALHEVAGKVEEFGRKLKWDHQDSAALGLLDLGGVGVLGAGLAAALHREGWRLVMHPGYEVEARRDRHCIQPFAAVRRMADGKADGTEWREKCERAGIGGLRLA